MLLFCSATAIASTNILSTTNHELASSSNWDEILDEYEAYVAKYIVIQKKVASGDIALMTEAFEMLEQASKLSEQLQREESQLTSAQLSRLLKITQKMAEAAQPAF